VRETYIFGSLSDGSPSNCGFGLSGGILSLSIRRMNFPQRESLGPFLFQCSFPCSNPVFGQSGLEDA
jgi:hypothetical protein